MLPGNCWKIFYYVMLSKLETFLTFLTTQLIAESLHWCLNISVTVAIALAGVFGQDLSEIPADLTFSCVGKSYGYYADVSTNCKVFHICLGDGDVKWSFLCPNQTSFHQVKESVKSVQTYIRLCLRYGYNMK